MNDRRSNKTTKYRREMRRKLRTIFPDNVVREILFACNEFYVYISFTNCVTIDREMNVDQQFEEIEVLDSKMRIVNQANSDRVIDTKLRLFEAKILMSGISNRFERAKNSLMLNKTSHLISSWFNAAFVKDFTFSKVDDLMNWIDISNKKDHVKETASSDMNMLLQEDENVRLRRSIQYLVGSSCDSAIGIKQGTLTLTSLVAGASFVNQLAPAS